MKLLFLSCHEVLERDEVALFHELGHQIFSPGAYLSPENPGGMLHRPGISGMAIDPDILAQYHKECATLPPGADFKDHLTKEFVDNFDAVIIMHMPRWIDLNWEAMKHKTVILRTIGQSNKLTERSLKRYRAEGMKIVRYSPKEKFIPEYIGEDAMIRFYKDPEEYQGYTGSVPRIVTLAQSMFGSKQVPSRGDHMSKTIFDAVVDGFDWRIFGPDNDFANEHNGGRLSFDDMKSMLRLNRAFLYTGTRPASYTLGGIEAMLTGIPIVSIGPVEGNAIYGQKTFEMHEILGLNKEYGFWSDSIEELREYCRQLLENQDLARDIGAKGRQRAIELFGKDTIKKSWKEFLDKC